MMPWEHAVVGYIVFSLLVRALYHRPPSPKETAVVVLASVLPDVIDKPLAWQFEVFGSGYAIGHSALVAVPVATCVIVLAWRRDVPRRGIAFATGYLLHLGGDVVPSYFRSGPFLVERILWPIRGGGDGYEAGFFGEAEENLTSYVGWMVEQIGSGSPDLYLLIILGMGGFGFALWIADGMPIGRQLYGSLRQSVRQDSNT